MHVGDRFSTHFETDCEVVTIPKKDGTFLGADSDGVVCEFSTAMVIGHPDEYVEMRHHATRAI